MNIKQGVAATALIASSLFASSANALVISFSESTSSSYTTSAMTFTEGGVTVSAQGQTSKDGGLSWGSAGMRSFEDYGLAVKNSTLDNTHQIDGSGWDDRVLFTFNQSIRLVSASFTMVDAHDNFAFWAIAPFEKNGAPMSYDELFPSTPIPLGGTYNFVSDWVGSQFAIGALGNCDDFKLKSLNVEIIPTTVPEPATLALLGLGLFGLGLSRHKKS